MWNVVIGGVLATAGGLIGALYSARREDRRTRRMHEREDQLADRALFVELQDAIVLLWRRCLVVLEYMKTHPRAVRVPQELWTPFADAENRIETLASRVRDEKTRSLASGAAATAVTAVAKENRSRLTETEGEFRTAVSDALAQLGDLYRSA